MTPDKRQGGALPDAAPSTISPHQATDAAEDNATAHDAEGTNLDDVLDTVFAGSTRRRQRPSLLELDDEDAGLFYTARVNWLSGAMGSGKSWAGCVLIAAVLLEGGEAGYIDCESDAATIVGRLRDLGVPRDAIAAGFAYQRPYSRTDWHGAVGTLLRRADELDAIVIDGVAAAFDLTGTNGNDAVEVKAWVRKGPAALARHTRAGVVCIDHLPRAGGDAPAGSFHKHDTVDGVAYVLEAEHRPVPGGRGVLALRNVKDRPGGIDAMTSRGSVVGRIVLDATADNGMIQWAAVRDVASARPTATVSADQPAPRVETPEKRDEDLMRAASRCLEVASEPLSSNKVVQSVKGTAAHVRHNLALLVAEGYVVREEVAGRGPKATHRHRLVTPYPGSSPARASSPPLRGVGGRTTQGAPTAPTQIPTQDDAPPTHSTQGASEDHDAPPTQPHRSTHSLAVVR